MKKKDFINEIIGTPWVNRAYGFDGCDCFGAVYLYMRHVMGVITELTTEYLENEDFSAAFQAQLDAGKWLKVDSPTGEEVVFMCFAGDIPMHCGIMIDRTRVLHAFGTVSDPRQVTIWTMDCMLTSLRRYYKLGENPRVEFYKWQS